LRGLRGKHYGAISASYGKVFAISRKALVNDDLGAFGDVIRRLGMAAAEFERQFLVNLLESEQF
jgi:phage major head subunit gpT-like protein